ncbi:hypothetical protein HVX40_24000 (plasmid) [Escherichia coli]|nr:hypothetical protein [Escherichia coli]MBA8354071.1 hypothetical protein [Escherichia coli]
MTKNDYFVDIDESRQQFEHEMHKLGDCVDLRRAKNGDEEYMAWDVALAWRFWNLSRQKIQISLPDCDKFESTWQYQDAVEELLESIGIKIRE